MKIHPLTILFGLPIIILLSVFGLPMVLLSVFQKQVNAFLDESDIDSFQFLIIMIGSELMWLFMLGGLIECSK